MTRARVSIELDAHGLGTLEVGGVDLGPYVTGATIKLRAGELPLVTLELVADETSARLLEAIVEIEPAP